MTTRIDPTANVAALVTAEARRQDDLREAEAKRINEQLALRSFYDEKLRDAEAKRIDANRAGDVAAVALANERSIQQAHVLAGAVVAAKEASQASITAMADVVAKNLAVVTGQTSDRLAALESSKNRIEGGAERHSTDRGQSNSNRAVYVTLGLFILTELIKLFLT